MFLDIGMGLSYLHSNQIIHKSLKTENILVCDDGTLKLIGFDGSKMVDTTLENAITAPEVFVEQDESDKVDVWALGCLMYEICEFKPAFSAATLIELVQKIRT